MFSKNMLPLIWIISFFWWGFFVCTVPVVIFSQGKGFNNEEDPLYGEDLFYTIHLQEVVFDYSALNTSSSRITTIGTTTPSITSGFTYLSTFGLVVIFLFYRKK